MTGITLVVPAELPCCSPSIQLLPQMISRWRGSPTRITHSARDTARIIQMHSRARIPPVGRYRLTTEDGAPDAEPRLTAPHLPPRSADRAQPADSDQEHELQPRLAGWLRGRYGARPSASGCPFGRRPPRTASRRSHRLASRRRRRPASGTPSTRSSSGRSGCGRRTSDRSPGASGSCAKEKRRITSW